MKDIKKYSKQISLFIIIVTIIIVIVTGQNKITVELDFCSLSVLWERYLDMILSMYIRTNICLGVGFILSLRQTLYYSIAYQLTNWWVHFMS